MYRKEYTERKHVIDFLFPLALFFALAASSVALVILASGSYSRQVPHLRGFLCQLYRAVLCDGKAASGR